jgi:class 3 adenylate cyclase/pimeloyl-ACP methyl ester carboxylesterase
MRYGPPINFTRNPQGSTIAYQVFGAGDLDLVFLFGWPTHLALQWDNPAFAEFLNGLASFARVIVFDRPGNGMSDRGPTGHAFEDWMDDITAVLAAVGSERAAFFGCPLGGRLALLYAATHPESTQAVVTYAAHPATLRDADYPWGAAPEDHASLIQAYRSGVLPFDEIFDYIVPEEVEDAAARRWFAVFFSSAASPVENVDEITHLGPVDIRGLLGAIRVPTLVLHRTGDRMADIRASKYLAERLPDARFHELPGENHLPFFGDADSILSLTQEFLTGTSPTPEPDRVVLTVMFTDIVDSTAKAARLGDRRWKRLLDEHDTVVRSALGRFRGREIETTGDGFLTAFDGPARAIRAAAMIQSEVADSGVGVRVGIHTGEVELVGERIKGIAVHIAARVMAQAGGGEIVCSRTVKDLVAGAGFRFTDRGSHTLKGVADEWQLYAVELTNA